MENKLRYIETSAKDNINVAKTFDDLIESKIYNLLIIY